MTAAAIARVFVNTDDDQVVEDLVDVVASGKQVKLTVGDVTVMMSPSQAQQFAFRLAAAYARAGRLARGHFGQYALEESVR